MKTINVVFEDKEYEWLTRRKGKLSWHDFIMRRKNKEAIENDMG